jgi:hypothetical protein
MEFGRLIRLYGLQTVELKAGVGCVSACALAFLGGVERFAEAGSIGVHRSSFSQGAAMPGNVATAAVQQGTADIITYMNAMGADPSLLQVAYSYDSTDMRYLSASEMARYRVTTSSGTTTSSLSPAAPVQPTMPQAASTNHFPDPPQIGATGTPAVLIARSGEVRHPNGFVFLRASANTDSSKTAKLVNGTKVKILESSDRWYRVRVENQVGFLRATWVKVDQFEPTLFDRRFIQIASYATWPEVEQFLKYETLPTAVHLASSGWYAVTLAGSFDPKQGSEMLARIKSQHLAPEDSFLTYGNTYAVKIR